MIGFLIFLAIIVFVAVFVIRSRSTPTIHNSNQTPQGNEVKHDRWHTDIELKTPIGLQELNLDAEDELSKFVKEIPLEERKEHYFRANLVPGHDIGIGVTRGRVWIDVISRKRRGGEKQGAFTGSYTISGFHITESRWSYGDGPPGALIIRKLLADHFGTPERRRYFV